MRAVLPGALAAVDPAVWLGALLYPAGGAQECAGPTGLAVPFGRANGGAIAQALGVAAPTGRTPTFAALVQAERLLAGVTVTGPRAVILAVFPNYRYEVRLLTNGAPLYCELSELVPIDGDYSHYRRLLRA
jgi:hypothetical protein